MKSTKPKRFQKVNIEITNICNLQCSFCPEVIRAKEKMDLALFRKIIPQVAELSEQVCFHLMGEPLVHPDLISMIDVCAENSLPVHLVSNGVLLNRFQNNSPAPVNSDHPLLHPIIRQINFSLHSFFDNFPERNPDTYLKTIFEFTDLALRNRSDLYLNFRLWNLDAPQGTPAQKRNIEMLDRISKHFQDRAQWIAPSEIDLKRKKNSRIFQRLYLSFDTEFVWPSLDLPIIGSAGTCKGLSSHFGILVDGTVVPCCLDKEGKIPLGDAKNQTIESALNGERAQKIFNGFRERKLVEDLCQRCNYIDRFSKKSTAHPLSKSVSDPLKHYGAT